MEEPIYKAQLQKLMDKANQVDKRRPGESELDRMKRLLIKSSVESIYDSAYFRAKMGNVFYTAEHVNKNYIIDIYEGVKLLFPDCKIYLKLNECSITVHWG
jgi:hypothetical protein